MITADHILVDLEHFIYKEVSATHDEKKALASARALFECLWINFRKGQMYIPTTDKIAQQQRYETIWAAFNGSNYAELAAKNRLSTQQIYTIINAMRTTHTRKHQTDLFPIPAPKTIKPLTLQIIEDYLPADLIKVGVNDVAAQSIAKKLSNYLCEKYPGVSIHISDALHKKRANIPQLELF